MFGCVRACVRVCVCVYMPVVLGGEEHFTAPFAIIQTLVFGAK